MLKMAGICSVLSVVLLSQTACERIPERGPPGEEGRVPTSLLEHTDSIPLGWGRLVSVTTDPVAVGFRLWFENDAGEIRSVGFDTYEGRLWTRVIEIPRQGGAEQ